MAIYNDVYIICGFIIRRYEWQYIMMFILYVVSLLASQVLVSSLKKETEFITPNVKITVESTPKHRPRLQRKGNSFIT